MSESEAEVLAAVASLGVLRPRRDLATSLAATHMMGVDEAADVLFRHKVANIALGRLREAGTPIASDLVAVLSELRSSFNARYATAKEVVDVIEQGVPHGVEVRTMKGVAVSGWYPDTAERDIGDIDLWTRSMADGWAIARVLRDFGYLYAPEELPWMKGDLRGSLYGQMRLVHPERVMVSVDIHVGPYSVRHCGRLPIDIPADARFAPLPPEELVCTAVGNAAGDCFIDVKTVNDMALALESDHLDIPRLRVMIDAAGLSPFTNSLLDVVDDLVEPTDRRVRVAEQLRLGTEREPIRLTRTADAGLRAEIVSAHAREMARRLHLAGDVPGGSAFAETLATEAFAAYTRESRLSVRETPQADAQLAALVPWTCIRLVPRETLAALGGTASHDLGVEGTEVLVAGVSVLHTRVGDAVAAGGDVFVPTVDYQLPAGLVAAVLAAG